MDPVTAARTAREGLARGLGLLQSPALPPYLSRVVEQVAQAMSLLHRIESTRGVAFAETAPQALAITRQALGELQSFNLPHPEVEGALEAIAGSLGTIHQLAQSAAQHPPASAEPAPVSPYAGTMLDAPRMPPLPPQPAHYPTAPQPPSQSQPYQAQPHYPPPQSHHAQPHYAQPPYPQQQPYTQPSAQYPAPPPSQVPGYPQSPYGAPPASSQWQPQSGWQQPASAPRAPDAPQPPHPPAPDWEQKPPPPSRVPAPVGPGAPVRIEAALGAHSPTNFYKGLGNDVIEAGGLFVATYQIPPIGTQVHLKVALPGGYEFEAIGVVRWARETRDTSSDAPPGFGAQIVQITPEARQLVYRYVRNREPLFHDDI